MLSDERIRELALGTYRADSVDDACEEAIRVAVAETAEACKAELAAANEAKEKAISACELLSGTRDIAHAGNVSAAMQSVADERDALRAEVERLRLGITPRQAGDWCVHWFPRGSSKSRIFVYDHNLLRAICLCAARVQQARETKE